VARFAYPQVLVLGGGGILGEAWMAGVLSGLADATGFDARGCGAYVGTSAGSIVAASLVAGIDPGSRYGELPEQPPVSDPELAEERGTLARALELAVATGGSAVAPLAAVGLRSAEPGGALLRRALLSRVPDGRRELPRFGRGLEEAGARWDGRLSVSAVDLQTGRRVMFGSPGSPAASVGEAVEASCAIPGFFRPVVIGGRSYVDGGAWSPTNMDRAPVERGTTVLCLNPTGSMRPSMAAPFSLVAPVSRSIAAVEALALRRQGAAVTVVSPDAGTVAAMGPNLMASGPRDRVHAAGVAQGRAL
jgi:NTE family protein